MMNWKVVMKDEIYDKIHTLMEYNEEINSGNEIGGWLTGTWQTKGDDATLLLDNFIIPKQKVTSVEVDISPESMIDTIKEIGLGEANRIKAHWHIHPFGKGETGWSGTDEEKIQDFMHPDKQREIFVFLLSSNDQLFARVEIRAKMTFWGQTQVVGQAFDKLAVEREHSRPTPINPYVEALKSRISEKVEVEKTVSSPAWDKDDWKNDTRCSYQQTNLDDEEDYVIHKGASRLHLRMKNEFAEKLEQCAVKTILLQYPTKKKEHKHSGFQTWKYDTDGDFRTVDDIETQIMIDLDEVENDMTWKDDEEKYLGMRGYIY